MKNITEEKILQKFYSIVGIDSTLARNLIFDLPYKRNAYLLSLIALTYRDEGMFFKNNKTRKRFNNIKINLAKVYIDKAFKLNSNCNSILYTKGTIYNALNFKIEAIECYIKILQLGSNLDTESNCSKSDQTFNQMILNDSRFQLYRLFFELEEFEISSKFLKEYKKFLKKGIDTIYKPLELFLM